MSFFTRNSGLIRLYRKSVFLFCLFLSVSLNALAHHVGDRVWRDDNLNGIQDTGEPGIQGVTVVVKNAAGTIVGTDVTDAGGLWLVSICCSGNYTVEFPAMVSGYPLTTKDAGSDDTADSDANPATGVAAVFIPVNGYITTVDAGYAPNLRIGNRVWYDRDSNGVDQDEIGLYNVTVRLYRDNNNNNNPDGAAIATTTTNINGFYTFSNLSPGNYIVGVVMPANYTNSPVAGGDPDNNIDKDNNGMTISGTELRTRSVTISALNEYDGTINNTSTNNTVDVGLKYTGPFVSMGQGNFIWFDVNVNGQKDLNEPGIAGLTVNLYLDADNNSVADRQMNAGRIGAVSTNLVSSTVTDASGVYSFGNLVPGNYMLGVEMQAGMTPVSINGGDPDNDIDNDNNGTLLIGTEILSPAVTLSVNGEPGVSVDNDDISVNSTVDFALRGTASLGDFVWNDITPNGIQEANEHGIPNVTVTLFSGPVQIGEPIRTGPNGVYSFQNLIPGTYTLQFTTIPPGRAFSPKNAPGSNPHNNSDVNGLNGLTDLITLTLGEARTDIDAGVSIAGSPLPVHRLDLSVAATGADQLLLTWIAENEANTAWFVAERSIDGANFAPVLTKQAAGISNITTTYSAMDDISLLTHNGVLYYRIKAMDRDGKTAYSNIVQYRSGKTMQVKLWPNPFQSAIRLQVTAKQSGPATVRVTDAAGKLILTKLFSLHRGDNFLSINPDTEVPVGLYQVQIIRADGTRLLLTAVKQ